MNTRQETKSFIALKPLDFVIHRGSTKYLIINDNTILEHNARPAFEYVGMDGKVWERAQDLMQDGRFTLFEPTPEEFKILLTHYRNHLNGYQKRLYALERQAPTIIIQRGESAINAVTGYHYGWYCPDSPDHLCYYTTNSEGKIQLHDGTIVNAPEGHDPKYESYDFCIYCGDPEERK